MKKIIYFLTGIILSIQVLYGQHFLTAGAGGQAVFNTSEGMEQFVSTYNNVNYPVLVNPISEFSRSFGWRAQIGYRYFQEWSFAGILGYQRSSFEDMSEFSNGEQRTFELALNSIYIEGEAGHLFGNFLLHGLLAFNFIRGVEMNTSYNGAEPRSLNGTYTGEKGFSTDVGISLGIYKEPFILMGKISYPVYTSGRDDRLIDDSPPKVQDNLEKFPNDYLAYVMREAYDGVSSDIDGIKIMIMLSYALPIGGNEQVKD